MRLTLAATTFGTNDVHYWLDFMDAVRDFGPVGIYGHDEFEAAYNHPPPIGFFLLLVNHLSVLGLPAPLLLRLPAVLADGVTCGLVYKLVSEKWGESRGAAAAVALALSPALIVVSGFHGNTDPVFVAVMIGAFRLVGLGHPRAGGAVLALASSVKIAPMVAIPLLVWMSGRHGGWRGRVGFLGAGTAVGLLLWGPALLARPSEVWAQVIGYRGIGFTEWGVPQFLRWMSADGLADVYLRHAGLPVALFAAASAAILAARLRLDPGGSLAAGFVLLLTAAPAFGMQYLVWPLALGYLLHTRLANVYNVVASCLVLVVYASWTSAWPFGDSWPRDEAIATPFPLVAFPLMCLAWLCLVALLVDGIRSRDEEPVASSGDLAR